MAGGEGGEGGEEEEAEAADELVGCELDDGWWVKARILRQRAAAAAANDGQAPDDAGDALVPPRVSYLLCRGEGRRAEYRDWPPRPSPAASAAERA